MKTRTEHSPDYVPAIMLQTCPSCGKRVTVEDWADFEGLCGRLRAAFWRQKAARIRQRIQSKGRY